MYEFDWSSITPSLPYLLNGLVITFNHDYRCGLRHPVGHSAGGDAPVDV